jgi:hypothetical protein
MAKETTLEPLFLGTDFQYIFDIRNDAEDTSLDITGWALSFMLKRRFDDLDAAAILTKTTAGGSVVIAGTFNSDPDTNAQRATVTITDTDTENLRQGMVRWELKRMDDGFETILAYGQVDLARGVHRA